MSIEFEDATDTLRRITLTGRLDIPGTEAIALKLANLTSSPQRRIVLDISGVDFLASIGIRELISSAKSLQMRGSKLVLMVGSNANVTKTLTVTGIDTLIPMFDTSAAADQAALA